MRKKIPIITIILLSLIGSNLTISLISSNPIPITKSKPPQITLKAIALIDRISPHYVNVLSNHLNRIYITLDIEYLNRSEFYNQLYNEHDFDIFCMDLILDKSDVDFSNLYSSEGFYNIFGYDPMMDYLEFHEMGLNDLYLKEGTFLPINSEESIEHYWNWQNYLMSDILPLKPLFTYEEISASWSNLMGFNGTKGLLESWGDMWWDGLHVNQNSTSEIIIGDHQWLNLNPLYQYDSASNFISKACLDPLFWIEGYAHPFENNTENLWLHLVEDYFVLNETHLRLKLREGIKWQLDPDGLFSNEFLDVEDVYFTLYCWKHLSKDKNLYQWIKDMKIIDKYTLDIFVDNDPSTSICEPYANVFSKLNVLILPEHFLNQTQLPADEVTPDIAHSSWEKYSSNCFGTGLFMINNYTNGVETNLQIFDNCWWLNDTLTNDTKLNFENRFGTFDHGLDELCIKINEDPITNILEFSIGNIDEVSIANLDDEKEWFINDNNYTTQAFQRNSLVFFGYNLREDRTYIGDRSYSSRNPAITRGLALRKAISYAIDRSEINVLFHKNEAEYNDHPIYSTMDIYCSPNINRYYFDLDKALDYHIMADFQVPTTPNGLENWQKVLFVISGFVGLNVVIFTSYIVIKIRKKRIR
ncbi:MAG: hypothetical protein FK733_12120 [Asgard group archaeon]|nr:hypothetical protein [Asgard group archaeon]